MSGFGQSYWVQVVYDDDRDDLWVPVSDRTKKARTIARDAAALWLAQLGVEFVLVLDGRVRKGDIPTNAQILDDFIQVSDERADQAVVYTLQTKAARQRLIA